ncbi:hypothetical protein AVEN_38893-1 [Araneus ventricosus]|uniref:Uncharacterized protein n=1 Tax=Araneus ventricosus TaxID=182803 RepID=A0A4Y2P2N8_ARAVE|nr:hypothetical protein AVEN_38893-1 [Araneus ventricosus]
MKKEQEEMKNQIQAHVESQTEGMKDHVNSCINKIEEDAQVMKGEIKDVKGEVQRKTNEVKGKVQWNIEEIEGKVQEKISDIEKWICELEDRPNNFPASPEFMYSRQSVKPLKLDRLSSWSVFKTQFDAVSSTNGWTDCVKASQFVASLRGSAAEILQGIPAEKLTDLTTIENVLESQFGDSILSSFIEEN